MTEETDAFAPASGLGCGGSSILPQPRPQTTSAQRRGHVDAVVRYYRESWYDYHCFWTDVRSGALHMGYWGEGVRTHVDSLLASNRVLADVARVGRDEVVLDAGCGVGGSAIWLAQNCGALVVGVTVVPEQVEEARQRAKEAGLAGRVSFYEMDFVATDFADESFDVVWAQESLTHEPAKRAFLVESYRLLKPGGRLVVEDTFCRDHALPPRERRLVTTVLRGWAAADLCTVSEFRGWAEDIGFCSCSFNDINRHLLPSAARLRQMLAWLYPLELLQYALRLRTKVQHQHTKAAWRLARAMKTGLVFYGIFSAQKRSRAGAD
jgi:tocopherol O-methyltransferase